MLIVWKKGILIVSENPNGISRRFQSLKFCKIKKRFDLKRGVRCRGYILSQLSLPDFCAKYSSKFGHWLFGYFAHICL